MERDDRRHKIKEITDKIVREYRPEKIILFGSWAWGTPNEDSDVDILILKESAKSRIEREREVRRLLAGTVSAPLDVLVYTPGEVEMSINQNHNLFLEDIIRNGKILYSRSDTAVRIAHQRPLVILTP